MITELNLPKPSPVLLEHIYRVAQNADLELGLKAMHDRIQNYTRNSVSRKFVENDAELNKQALIEYGQYFSEKIIPAVGIVKNIQSEKYACWPPHADRVRIFALNFYVESGGENVRTVMYKRHSNYTPGPGTGEVYPYESLEKETEFCLKNREWYALSVRQAHSVEDIETTRIIFTLSFWDITYFDFLKKYPQYIKG
jgi:hypothetical protein